MKWTKAFRVVRQARNVARVARDLSSDDLLGYVGLQRKRTFASYIVPGLGFFAAGLAAGAGIGLLIAPSSGRELRQQIGTKVQKTRNRLGTATEHLHDRIVGVEEYPSNINETAQQAEPIGQSVKGPSLM